MRCIVNKLQVMPFCDSLQGIDITRIPVYMDCQDGASVLGNGGFDKVWIDAKGIGPDVDEHRITALPKDRIGSCDIRKWGCDHVAQNLKRPQGELYRNRAVGNEAQVRYFEIFCETKLQLLNQLTVIGQPPRGPQ